MEVSGLTVHVLYNDIVNFPQGGAVFQHLPGLIGVVVNLDGVLVAYGQQAVTLEVLYKVIVDGILIQVFPINEQLGIIAVFNHAFSSFLSIASRAWRREIPCAKAIRRRSSYSGLLRRTP